MKNVRWNSRTTEANIAHIRGGWQGAAGPGARNGDRSVETNTCMTLVFALGAAAIGARDAADGVPAPAAGLLLIPKSVPRVCGAGAVSSVGDGSEMAADGVDPVGSTEVSGAAGADTSEYARLGSDDGGAAVSADVSAVDAGVATVASTSACVGVSVASGPVSSTASGGPSEVGAAGLVAVRGAVFAVLGDFVRGVVGDESCVVFFVLGPACAIPAPSPVVRAAPTPSATASPPTRPMYLP